MLPLDSDVRNGLYVTDCWPIWLDFGSVKFSFPLRRVIPMDPKPQQNEGDALRWLARHLVSLSWFDQKIDKEGKADGPWRFWSASGFVMSFRNKWFLVTAGHIIQAINANIENRATHMKGCVLMDGFGLHARFTEPIPFVYDPERTFSIDDRDLGLDVGFIALTDYYRRLMEANKVEAIVEANWINQHKVTCDFHLMIGLPKEACSIEVLDDAGEEVLKGVGGSVIFRVTKMDSPPDDAPKTTYDPFVCTVDVSPDKLKDIDGMSGGPILGFRHRDGELRYWVVALQSWWFPKRRIAFGCPVPTFAAMVDRILAVAYGDGPLPD